MEIQFENIVLRDMKESDIEDYVRWFTAETEYVEISIHSVLVFPSYFLIRRMQREGVFISVIL